MIRDIHVPNGVVLAVAVIALTISSVALGAVVVGRSAPGGNYGGMMGGSSHGSYGGMMGGRSNGTYRGMMGGQSESANSSVAPQPGTAGFVPGTSASPRVIR